MTREINDAMGRSYDIPDDVDEADLMDELDALEGEMSLEEGDKATPSYLQVRGGPRGGAGELMYMQFCTYVRASWSALDFAAQF